MGFCCESSKDRPLVEEMDGVEGLSRWKQRSESAKRL